jgi:hypothetical protein
VFDNAREFDHLGSSILLHDAQVNRLLHTSSQSVTDVSQRKFGLSLLGAISWHGGLIRLIWSARSTALYSLDKASILVSMSPRAPGGLEACLRRFDHTIRASTSKPV